MAYHESWWDVPAAGPSATRLAALPGYVDIVALSFARPDAFYPGMLDLEGSGLQYPYSGKILKGAVALLHQRHPGTRVLLSVGGQSYTGWSGLNETALAAVVKDLGLDGIDIDYEPVKPDCRGDFSGHIKCGSDAELLDIVRRFRAVLPRPALLTITAWSVAAYGEGAYRDALPRYSRYTGSMLTLLRSPEAASLDLVSIMAYEAGPDFDPWQAFSAYRSYWPGPLALGVQVPQKRVMGPEAYTVRRVSDLAGRVHGDPHGGMMLYSLQAIPEGPPSDDNPTPTRLAGVICRALGLEDCDAHLP